MSEVDGNAARPRARFSGAGAFTENSWSGWHDRAGRVHLAEAPADLVGHAGVRTVAPMQGAAGVPGAGGMVAGVWSPPTPPPLPQPQRIAPIPPRRERPEQPERPGRPKRPERPQRRGWLARLLDRLTYTEPWDW
ncbi:hypothetical protein GCM10022214_54420 [Actinomadura miaoliensis]|uniref:Uncharacterized protein n=2 Tax=Actinomadura miaoliensis TaxID=430685 RepID=A0ABP7WGI9_9ACTN